MTNINVRINGRLINFAANDQRPINVEGRVLVPIRVLLEQPELGFRLLRWNNITNSAIFTNGTDEIILNVGANGFTVNGEGFRFLSGDDGVVTPRLIGGRMMVPIRAVFEALGYGVSWSDTTRTVYIATESVAYFIASYNEPSRYSLPLGRMLSVRNTTQGLTLDSSSYRVPVLNINNDERTWLFEDAGNGYAVIRPKTNPDLCLTAPVNAGGNLTLQEYTHLNDNQLWRRHQVRFGTVLDSRSGLSVSGLQARRMTDVEASLMELIPADKFITLPLGISHPDRTIGRNAQLGRLDLTPVLNPSLASQYNRFIEAFERPTDGRLLLTPSHARDNDTGLHHFLPWATGNTQVTIRHTLVPFDHLDRSMSHTFNVTVSECDDPESPNVRDHVRYEIVEEGEFKGYLQCVGCGKRIKSPEMQDREVLNGSSVFSTDLYFYIKAILSALPFATVAATANPPIATPFKLGHLLRQMENYRLVGSLLSSTINYEHSNDGVYARMHEHLYPQNDPLNSLDPRHITSANAADIFLYDNFVQDAFWVAVGAILFVLKVPAIVGLAFTALRAAFDSSPASEDEFLTFGMRHNIEQRLEANFGNEGRSLGRAVNGIGIALETIGLFRNANGRRINTRDRIVFFHTPGTAGNFFNPHLAMFVFDRDSGDLKFMEFN